MENEAELRVNEMSEFYYIIPADEGKRTVGYELKGKPMGTFR